MIEKTKVFENHSENEKDIITQVVNGLTDTDAGVDFHKNLVNDTEEEAMALCAKLYGGTPIAVKIKRPIIAETGKLKQARKNLESVIAKKEEQNSKSYLEGRKTAVCTCENCKSKLVIAKYLEIAKKKIGVVEGFDINRCPVCEEDMRPQSIKNKIAKYDTEIAACREKVETIEKELFDRAVNAKNCPTAWFVYWQEAENEENTEE